MSELILKVESKVISADVSTWKAQQEEFLASLTTTFETDEDFARAENEAKEIKAREDAAKAALDVVVNGSKDVSELIEQVNAVIEELAKARRAHTKIVKDKKESIKLGIATKKIDELRKLYDAETPISQAFSIRMPFSEQEQRIKDATKNKRKFDNIKSSVNTAFANISAEMMATVSELNDRLGMLPKDKMHLFSDAQALIASEDDLASIIESRINSENERIAQAEQQSKSSDVEQISTPDNDYPTEQPVIKPTNEPSTDEPKDKYAIIIDGATLSEIKRIAGQLKGQFASVTLRKLEK